MEVKPGDPEYATERSGVDKEELHREMLTRHQYARDYWQDQYEEAEFDMEFAFMPDKQWDDWMKESRTGRPMYTVNKLRQALKQITNDQRQNRPQAKVRAVENGDPDMAEVREGLMRSIDAGSDADRARDTAFQWAVGGGFGNWRVNVKYTDDSGFDPVIVKEEIPNPLSVVFDPGARKKDRSDARYAFVDQQYSRAAYMERWPDAEVVSISSTNDLTVDWWGEDEVLVSEYWYKVPEEVEILLLSNGKVVDNDEDFQKVERELRESGITIQKRRMVERHCVYQCIVSGAEILEGPTKWDGKYIPIIPVWGELLNIRGKDEFFGATRFAKDAQRMYNYERSTHIEVLADQPYSPFMADAASIEGYEDYYAKMRTKRSPVLFYNSKDAEGRDLEKPSREPPPIFPVALATSAQITADDLKAVTGIYDAGLGARSNETSGKAIIARQREGDIANFDYIDNLAYAIKYDFIVTNDLIGAVYNTERQIRIIGQDGAEKVVAVNQPVFDQETQEWVTLNDMSQGRFDIAVTVGPSYTTQRMEAAEALMQLSNDPGPLGMIAKAGFIEALDAPGMDYLRKAARKYLISEGLVEPGEDDEPPQPQQPNPKDVAAAEKDASTVRLNDAKTQQILAEVPANIQKAQAETERTQIENTLTMASASMQAQAMAQPMAPGMLPQVPNYAQFQ